MEFKKVGIVKARIKGLEKGNVELNNNYGYYTTNLSFESLTSAPNYTISGICCGAGEDVANKHQCRLVDIINNSNIFNEDEVNILVDSIKGVVLAFCKPGTICWLDVQHDYQAKQFKDLDIIITDLAVY